MASRIEWSGFEPWPGSLCCVLRQDTLLSQCSSSPRCTNGLLANMLGVTLRWTSSRFMLRKPELSVGPMGHLGLYKGFTNSRFSKLTSRIVWQTQKRITTEILELRGLRQGFEVVLPVVSLLSEDFSSILSARAIP